VRTVLLTLFCLQMVLEAPTQAEARPRPGRPGAFLAHGAVIADIQQNDGPTCWILASMAAVRHSGIDLSRRIRPQGKNWYAVTLYNFNDAKTRPGSGLHRQTVRVFFDGGTTPADPKFDPNHPRAAWVVILQRAVLQAVHDWDPSQSIESPHGGGAGDAMAILTGSGCDGVGARAPGARKTVRQALAAGRSVVMGRKGHYWAVLDMTRQGLRLYDPYGSRSTIPWSEAVADDSHFVIH
jgi:hypothetical protein